MTQPPELALVVEAFGRNARVNRAVFATLDARLLEVEDASGGFSVGQHLADMLSLRSGWLREVSPAHAEGVAEPIDMKSPTWLAASSIAELELAFEAWDAAISAAVLEAASLGHRFERAYPSHPAQLMIHCLVHDAHHRGQIMALLRRSGRSAEERERLEEATWRIWRE